jgi:hypothetical protein
MNEKNRTTEYLELITEPEKVFDQSALISQMAAYAAERYRSETVETGTPFRSMMMGDWNTEPINKSIIQKTMSFIKRLTQSADDKTLLKARFTDDCGNLTLTGNDALVSLVFAEKKADLVKLAEEVIAEEKE